MKLLRFILTAAVAATALTAMAGVRTANLSKARLGNEVRVRFDIVLDDLKLGSNKQLYITPVIQQGDSAAVLPAVLINGRNMHYGYQRKTAPVNPHYPVIQQEVWRKNGTAQSLTYSAETLLQPWMLSRDAQVVLHQDSCGCGVELASTTPVKIDLDLNPAPLMRLVQITPAVTQSPVTKHEGRARVQFEVDRTELHTVPYRTKRGRQLIDNREQLRIIDDSVRYALSDPNVEISSIEITGYASPESPYAHNDFLATNRSKALAEYLGEFYKLPEGAARYGAVPENWEEFRQQVVAATDITGRQRADLLELIDRPAYGPSDYDAKEQVLKTDPRFADLYRTKILPEWFPLLRATKFAINTTLRPQPDEKLAEIIKTKPQLLSLNQMFRVARLYPEGSDEFNDVIATALKYYPDDPVANLNSAVVAMREGKYADAAALLAKAGDSPEAENARGVLAAHNNDFDAAIRHFDAAGNLPEAVKNKAMLNE
ncbi:MAG: DUF3868 domain-containing protein [Muribaculaceae bacterium]